MRTFTIRYSTIVAAAIVAVVYTASVHKCTDRCDLLKRIAHEAEDLTQKLNEELLNKWVPKIVNGSCQKNAFCLAEKALKFFDNQPAKSKLQEDKKLERLLEQYNNMKNGTNCTLNKIEKCKLRKFLTDLKKCAGHAYNSTG